MEDYLKAMKDLSQQMINKNKESFKENFNKINNMDGLEEKEKKDLHDAKALYDEANIAMSKGDVNSLKDILTKVLNKVNI